MMRWRWHVTKERKLEIRKERWKAILKETDDLEDQEVDGRTIILGIK
jgi:hypothetical protein